MRLVLDTTILIAALTKDSLIRALLFSPHAELLLPENAFEELASHRQKLLRHSGLKLAEVEYRCVETASPGRGNKDTHKD
jgi:predicted nucleic acid-binding protein